MQDPVRAKRLSAFVFLFSLFCLSAAIYLQVSKDWFPCPLCILQRYAFLATAIIGLVGIVSSSNGNGGRLKVVSSAMGIAAVLGLGVALYHVWVLSNPGQTCGVDPLQIKLNNLPWTPLWPTMFEADGLCSAEYPPFLGLHLPSWSALGFLVQALCAVMIWRSSRSASVFR